MPIDATFLKSLSPEQRAQLHADASRIMAERHLYEFFKQAWEWIDPAPFTEGWHLAALADHLEAVARGQIKRLLVNLPPRHTKSLMVSVAFPAWLWACKPSDDTLFGAQTKVMCLSYNDDLALDNARAMRRLILSQWYQKNWGDRVKIRDDRGAVERFDTTAGGTRMSSSFQGTLTGRGGDLRLIDDPHKVGESESDVVRSKVIRDYDGSLRSRVTDPRKAAEVTVMQRTHDLDLSGHLISLEDGCVHLCLPAEYERARHCVTYIGDEPFWEDPRIEDGEVLWPEKWGPAELKPFKIDPYIWAGQYQQSPVPRGGGIIKSDWWQPWPPTESGEQWITTEEYVDDEGRSHNRRRALFPPFELIVASLDTAYTEKEENDPSACTLWGIFRGKNGHPNIMLISGWKEWLEFDALLRKTVETCKKRGVDALLIEDKASGISLKQEIKRRMGRENFTVYPIPVSRDKVARMHSAVPAFSGGIVFAPGNDELGIPTPKNIQMVIDECTSFPKGQHRDLGDTISQAINYLRRSGIALLAPEAIEEDMRRRKHRPKTESISQSYGI